MRRRDIASFVALTALCIVCVGCGDGDFGYVEGTVTVDGKPVERALIGFYPAGGRGSVGTTDSEGHYSLQYTAAQKGASIGSHKVTITTEIQEVTADSYSEYDQPAAGEVRENIPGRKELLDRSYQDRRKTPLTATVVAGSNPPIDFALESKK